MGREVLHRGVALEDVLRAVAVVDVEIEDRDSGKPVRGERLSCACGHAVEKAEAHGALAFGMVAGRAHGAEGVAAIARDHRVDRRAGGAGRAQYRLARAW
jgi:hypothetical protein